MSDEERGDYFASVFDALLTPPVTGVYTFHVNSISSSEIKVDGNAIVSSAGDGSSSS